MWNFLIRSYYSERFGENYLDRIRVPDSRDGYITYISSLVCHLSFDGRVSLINDLSSQMNDCKKLLDAKNIDVENDITNAIIYANKIIINFAIGYSIKYNKEQYYYCINNNKFTNLLTYK